MPRDRDGSFEPQIVPQHQTRFAGLRRQDSVAVCAGHDDARNPGTPGRDLRGGGFADADLERDRGGDGGGEGLAEAAAGAGLSDRLPGRAGGEDACTRAGWRTARCMWPSASTMEGQKEVLGLWTSANEGAKFWLQVLTELQNRGVKDIFIACVDGLKGFPQAIETVFPKTTVQLCIVHLVRASLNYVNWKERKAVAADLRSIYRAATAEEARAATGAVRRQVGSASIRPIAALWRRNWQRVIPFFQFPAEIRKVIYTTNAIESR